MAKPNKRRREGYFQKNVNQYGENFLNMKTAENIKYDAKNIFKDIAFTSVEKEKGRTCVSDLVPFFNNLTFVANLYNAALQEYYMCNATCIGLQTYISMAMQRGVWDPSQHLEEAMGTMQNKAYAYNIICAHLNNILSVFNISGDDDWIKANIENQLKSLSIQLSKYRAVI